MKEKVILLGDSITQGLGSKKINFTEELQNMLGEGYSVSNMALTGTTIHYAEEILPSILQQKPRYVVIVYGNVDAQIRPCRTGKVFKHIPKRFQKNGMLMPRPFYSHTLKKKIAQKVENTMRSFYSELICAVDGTEQWVDIQDFSETYRRVLDRLINEGIDVLACSTVAIDNKMFPGSLEQYERFDTEIQIIAEAKKIPYVDVFSPLKRAVCDGGWKSVYCYDHFHPNEGGYKIMAEVIADNLIGER